MRLRSVGYFDSAVQQSGPLPAPPTLEESGQYSVLQGGRRPGEMHFLL